METQLADKIRSQYERMLAQSPGLATHFADIAKRLGQNPDIFLEGFIKYDSNVGAYGNQIYDELVVKAGMYAKFFVQESYQYERQLILKDMMCSCPGIRSIVDVGFAVPGFYVKELLEERNEVQLTLLDKFSSSLTFAEAVFASRGWDWRDRVKLGIFDMDKGFPPGLFDVYVFFDSLEHTQDPTSFLKTLVTSAPERSTFLFSLPVERQNVSGRGTSNPMHFIEFKTEEEIRRWVKQSGLTIVEERSIAPGKGDFWLPEEGAFSNLIVKAVKR